jgi:hypothetical protein
VACWTVRELEACDYLSARDDLQGYFCDIEGWKVAPVAVSEEDARSLPQVFWSRERVAKALEQLGVEGDG